MTRHPQAADAPDGVPVSGYTVPAAPAGQLPTGTVLAYVSLVATVASVALMLGYRPLFQDFSGFLAIGLGLLDIVFAVIGQAAGRLIQQSRGRERGRVAAALGALIGWLAGVLAAGIGYLMHVGFAA